MSNKIQDALLRIRDVSVQIDNLAMAFRVCGNTKLARKLSDYSNILLEEFAEISVAVSDREQELLQEARSNIGGILKELACRHGGEEKPGRQATYEDFGINIVNDESRPKFNPTPFEIGINLFEETLKDADRDRPV